MRTVEITDIVDEHYLSGDCMTQIVLEFVKTESGIKLYSSEMYRSYNDADKGRVVLKLVGVEGVIELVD